MFAWAFKATYFRVINQFLTQHNTWEPDHSKIHGSPVDKFAKRSFIAWIVRGKARCAGDVGGRALSLNKIHDTANLKTLCILVPNRTQHKSQAKLIERLSLLLRAIDFTSLVF